VDRNSLKMANSIKAANLKFAQKAGTRGTNKQKDDVIVKPKKTSLDPLIIGLFVFLVVGSALFSIIRTATRGGYSE